MSKQFLAVRVELAEQISWFLLFAYMSMKDRAKQWLGNRHRKAQSNLFDRYSNPRSGSLNTNTTTIVMTPGNIACPLITD